MANDDVTESAAMNENEFRYAGKTFVAVEDIDLELCWNCSFKTESPFRFSCETLRTSGEIPHCAAKRRKDGRNVHFVEKGALDELKGESGGATAESTATQLALQDAEQAEARTREERDKLREEVEKLSRANAELAAKNVELRDAAEAEARTREERDKLHRWVADLRCKVAELNEKIRDLEHEKHCEALRAEALAVSRDKWKASSEAMAEALAAVKERTERTERTEGGSGGNAEASL